MNRSPFFHMNVYRNFFFIVGLLHCFRYALYWGFVVSKYCSNILHILFVYKLFIYLCIFSFFSPNLVINLLLLEILIALMASISVCSMGFPTYESLNLFKKLFFNSALVDLRIHFCTNYLLFLVYYLQSLHRIRTSDAMASPIVEKCVYVHIR